MANAHRGIKRGFYVRDAVEGVLTIVSGYAEHCFTTSAFSLLFYLARTARRAVGYHIPLLIHGGENRNWTIFLNDFFGM
jgi:hypothetical protein